MAKRAQKRSRGTIVDRGEGRWLCRGFVGNDPDTGKRRYASRMVRGSYTEAQRVLTELLGEADRGEYIAPSKETVAQYLDRWLKAIEGDVSPRTLEDYTRSLRRYIRPHIGGIRLDRLTALDVRKLHSRIQQERVQIPGVDRLVSPRDTAQAMARLKQALQDAVEWGLIRSNPAAGRRRRRSSKVVNLQDKREETLHVEVYTPEQVRAYLAAAETVDPELYPMWLLAFNSGLRPQEYLALEWKDLLEREDGTYAVQVNKALTQQATGPWKPGSPKSRSGYREVPIGEHVWRGLQSHKAAQAAAILRRGQSYQRKGYVFAATSGTYYDRSNIRDRWHKVREAAGLPKVRPYVTRHTYATILLSEGVDVLTIAKLLGHTDPTLVMRTYGHVLKTMQTKAAVILEKALMG